MTIQLKAIEQHFHGELFYFAVQGGSNILASGPKSEV